ncbi:unnamed protein product [Enterobius vermicularis]|uniref:APS kinase n=1 Tax=Enterobius vermicularis TaxID=51028 RepID=A0A0N4UW26_ENTVE|nr:unnamed protein product [Enterobius vermicularis]
MTFLSLSKQPRGLRKCFCLEKSSPPLLLGACPIQMHKVTRRERGNRLGCYPGFRGCTIWLTGLSGAGKTTVAFATEKVLTELGLPSYALDGDNVRNGLCKNLGFISKLFADMGVITLASFISPYACDRNGARQIHLKDGLKFFEVYVNTPLNVCEKRDPKKFYEKARAGKLKGFTGVDSDYEVPEAPDLILKAGEWSENECVRVLLEFLYEKGILPTEAFRIYSEIPVKELFVTDVNAIPRLLSEAAGAPKIEITEIDRQWLQVGLTVLSEGWATPLKGFMRERQYLQCLHHGLLLDLKRSCVEPGFSSEEDPKESSDVLQNPVNQSVPIVLPVTDEQKKAITSDGVISATIALTFKEQIVAVLKDPELFPHRKEERVARQFGFTDRRHPTINMIMDSGDWLLGGDIEVFDRIKYKDGLDEYRLTPMELRQRFQKENCDAVFVFQLRNPIHNGHALLMRDTREQLLKKYKNPMLLLHPLGGWTKDDDVPLNVRIEQHKAVMEEGVLDPNNAPYMTSFFIQVQWHARSRLAAGVTTYIVGRDPAGLAHPDTGDYLYDPTHGSKVLTMAPGLSDLNIIPFRVAAYDKKQKKMAFFDPSRKDDFLFISGTKMRRYAREGVEPPEGFMSPKAWKTLASYYQKKSLE